MKKVFVIKRGETWGYNCNVDFDGKCINIQPFEECEYVHVNTDSPVSICVGDKSFEVNEGLTMVKI